MGESYGAQGSNRVHDFPRLGLLEDTPTAVLVRQVLGAIAQFEKAGLVAKLAAARNRKRMAAGKCEGRKSLRGPHATNRVAMEVEDQEGGRLSRAV
jgi:hypothetical protein